MTSCCGMRKLFLLTQAFGLILEITRDHLLHRLAIQYNLAVPPLFGVWNWTSWGWVGVQGGGGRGGGRVVHGGRGGSEPKHATSRMGWDRGQRWTPMRAELAIIGPLR